MKLFWLRVKFAFWKTQAYLHQFTPDASAVQTALREAEKIEWQFKWRLP